LTCLRTLIAGLALILIPVATQASTFNVIFTGGSPLPSGTVTFAADGPANTTPTSFSFSDGNHVWTESDSIIQGAFNTQWSGLTPISFTNAGGNVMIHDDQAMPFGGNLQFTYNPPIPTWATFTSALGTYSFQAVPEPVTFSMLALGALALGLRRPRAAAR